MLRASHYKLSEESTLNILHLLLTGIYGKSSRIATNWSGLTDWNIIEKSPYYSQFKASLLDGLEILGLSESVPRALVTDMINRRLKLEKQSAKREKRLAEIFHRFRENRIDYYLLGGVAFDLALPTSNHIETERVEIFVGPNQYKRVLQIVEDYGVDNDNHVNNSRDIASFRYGDMVVVVVGEIRYTVKRIGNLFNQRAIELLSSNTLESLSTFNLILYCYSLYQQYITSKISLSSLLKWGIYLYGYADVIDREQLYEDLQSARLLEVWCLMGELLRRYSAMDTYYIPFYNKDYQRYLDDLIQNNLNGGLLLTDGEYISSNVDRIGELQGNMGNLFRCKPLRRSLVEEYLAALKGGIKGSIKVMRRKMNRDNGVKSRHVVYENATMIAAVIGMLNEERAVVMKVRGVSMLPFIVGDVDSVELRQCSRYEVGDIVLASTLEGNYLLHRIVEKRGSRFILMGDGNIVGKEVCRCESVYAKATYVITPKGRRTNLYSKCSRFRYRLWSITLPIRRYQLAIIRRLIPLYRFLN